MMDETMGTEVEEETVPSEDPIPTEPSEGEGGSVTDQPTDTGGTSSEDATYDIPENPTYNPSILKLKTTDPNNADTLWNPLFSRLIENIAALKVICDNALQLGVAGTADKFDHETTAPTDISNTLRYNGIFRATRVYGMYYSPDADVAELYPIKGAIEPGELVMICADGTFRRNTIAGNPRVLGIVSTAPAMVLGDGDSGVPIALCGRVPVKIEGKVTAGDLLCGAATPGRLTRADDCAPRGSVVAQALESGEGGVTTALVLRL